MALAGEASRRFTFKLNNLLDKNVTVKLVDGTTYRGKLTGIDPSSMSIVLENASSEDRSHALIVIYGSRISEIIIEESAIFNAREFAEFLVNYGGIAPHMINIYDDLNVVEVARGVRVSKDGVEGTGAMAQKVFTLFKEYMRKKGVNV